MQLLVGVAVPLSLLALWELGVAGGRIDGRIYPAPTSTFDAAWDLLLSGDLLTDIIATTKRLLAGYVIGAVLGVTVGVATGMSQWVRAAFEPSLNALFVTPKLALLPIFITMFGFGDAPMIVMVAVSVFLFTWIHTMEAIVSVPIGYVEAAKAFGTNNWGMFRHVLWPGALPQMFVGLRISMSISVIIVIAAEYVLGNDGLGDLIFTSRELFVNTWVFAGIFVVAIEGVLLSLLVERAASLFTPWAPRTSRRSGL